MQQAYLLEEDTVDVRFMGVYHDDNAKVDLLAGKALAGFWDRCEKAGPKSRSASGFHQELPSLECLSVVDGEIKLFE